MPIIRFVLFCLGFGLILYMHFWLAHRAWRRSKRREPMALDRGYIRVDDYFGRSFRSKVREWLQAAQSGDETGETSTSREGERLRWMPALDVPSDTTEHDVLAIKGDFLCGPECTFKREVYTEGDCRIGARTQLRAIAASGNVSLGQGVVAMRWVSTERDLDVGAGAWVRSRAIAGGTVRMASGARVHSVAGQEIVAGALVNPRSENGPDVPETYVYIPPLPGFGRSDDQRAAGLDASRLMKLSADTWMYRGHLRVSVPVKLTAKLIVKGDCFCPPGSLLEDDIKAAGSLHIGAGSTARGSMCAGKEVRIGPDCRFHGVVQAGTDVTLGAGSQGGRDDGQIAVFARRTVYVEEGASILNGKLAGTDGVVVVAAAGASEAPAAEPRRRWFGRQGKS